MYGHPPPLGDPEGSHQQKAPILSCLVSHTNAWTNPLQAAWSSVDQDTETQCKQKEKEENPREPLQDEHRLNIGSCCCMTVFLGRPKHLLIRDQSTATPNSSWSLVMVKSCRSRNDPTAVTLPNTHPSTGDSSQTVETCNRLHSLQAAQQGGSVLSRFLGWSLLLPGS